MWFSQPIACRSCDEAVLHYRYAWWHWCNFPFENSYECFRCGGEEFTRGRKKTQKSDIWRLTEEGMFKAKKTK